MHARVVLGVGKGVLFREVSSFQEYPHRERFYYAQFSLYAKYIYTVPVISPLRTFGGPHTRTTMLLNAVGLCGSSGPNTHTQTTNTQYY